MLERAEELKQRIRETPLDERLDNAKRRIGRMCSEGRPPRMTIPVQYDDDDFYISTTLSDAQATIADLQGQLKAAKAPRMYDCGSCAIGKGFEQRVAQLEAGVNVCRERYDKLSTAHGTLQADHARVLGLVQALGVVGLPAEHTRPDDFILLKTGEGWMAHTYNYWAKFATEEEARAYIALLEYRASLPAQPAQGGASKPVTTCNRHSDCDAADEKARAKGALHADHCHDDCCSECFGN